MTAASRIAAASANSARATSCTKTGNGLHPIAAVMRVARQLWPSKTALELSSRTGASERMCKYWLAERFRMSGEDIALLLRSDDGLQFLEAMMGEARPVWWRKMQRSARRTALRSAQRELQRQIDQLELELDQ